MVAWTPRPGSDRISLAAPAPPWTAAAATIARASGCSLSDSTPPASRTASSIDSPAVVATSVITWAPLVRVPVLSNKTVLTVRIRSRARRSLTRIPDFAATAVDKAMTSGMARPRACGQAITRTVTVLVMAWSMLPSAHQVMNVTTAAPRATQNSRAAKRSASAWARLPLAWASATRRWIPASAVSSPTASTCTRSEESVETVPATTRSPIVLATGLDSPVIIDSSNSAVPSTIVASAGTRPPARTNTTSPTDSSWMDTVSTMSSWTRSASSGSSSANAASAPRAWPMAFISCQWPSSMIVTSAASSHQNSKSSQPTLVAIDDT